MKPIKLKELLRTAKDPATQKIAIAENYTLYVVPLFEGLVKDVDKTESASCQIGVWKQIVHASLHYWFNLPRPASKWKF